MHKFIVIISLFLLVGSCQLFQKQTEEDIIARVGNHSLYEEDIQNLVGPGTPSADSILIVNSFIDNGPLKNY